MVNAYTLGDAARILKVSPARLRRWGRASLVQPSLRDGERPAYAFRDLVSVRSLLGLLDNGVSISRIRRSVEVVRATMPDLDQPMSALRVWAEGSDRVVMRQGDVLIEVGGQTVFDFNDAASEPQPAAPARLLTADAAPSEVFVEGQCTSAREWFERGCQLDSDPDTCRAAMDAYANAISLDPELADAHCNLGSLHFNRNRRGTARLCFERALAIHPEHLEANLNIAIVFEEEGRNESALRHYKIALSSDPLYADTHVSLALLYEKLDLRRKARSHWQRYVGLDPDGAWGDVARSRLEL